jgi:putative spermidine/putrescine transport system ATP-binding protein
VDGGAEVPGGRIPGLAVPAEGARVSVRPEDIRLTTGDAPIRGRVKFVRDLGANIETFVLCGEQEIAAVSTAREGAHLAEGVEVGVIIRPEDCVVLKG